MLSRRSATEFDNCVDTICEQYLPRVYQYVSLWVTDRNLAEDLTLQALKKALNKTGSLYEPEESFLSEVLTVVRQDIHRHSGARAPLPALSGLSSAEQEIMALKLAARLDNQQISRILGLSESIVRETLCRSFCKLKSSFEVKQDIT